MKYQNIVRTGAVDLCLTSPVPDEPGIAASEKWVRTLMAHGRETIATVLPAGTSSVTPSRTRSSVAVP